MAKVMFRKSWNENEIKNENFKNIIYLYESILVQKIIT